MGFLDENYLLTNDTAKRLFNIIKSLPIVDAHNHSDAHEIAENENYTDIWQAEVATDHYIWELMRKRGVSETFITGTATNEEKWMKLAEIFEDLVGNPVYEWVHLDLRQRLGITELISKTTAQSIWNQAIHILQQENKRPQQILKEMSVESMCTTNDPIDLLADHKKLMDIYGKGYIRPTWRPDNAMNIFRPTWVEYVEKLGQRVEKYPLTLDDFIEALRTTHDYFAEFGCITSDHGMLIPLGFEVNKEDVEDIYERRINDEETTEEEHMLFMSYMLHEFAQMDVEKGWVMQLHIGAVRDARESLLTIIGPDSGGDISNHTVEIVDSLLDLLNSYDEKNPILDPKYRGLKVVLYCLDPSHQPTLATITRAFGKNVNLGAAWWFNDTPIGMKRQLEYISSVDLLMNYAGMVTDSRKLLSYGSRTEMFRRVLADVLGSMVEKGQIPEELAIKTAKHVCYDGPKHFFGF
ncbi:MAG: glucuronate isomerase [Candidatus Lokiarchaeota archaeon]|nr:glucuronate isomerase [Candidatus Lokiarchaeota archaeon]